MINVLTEKGESAFPPIFESRAIFEFASFYMALPLLNTAPKGDGHPVIILPHPLGNSEFSAMPLRAFLRSKGYAVYEKGPEINSEALLSDLKDGIDDDFIAWLYTLKTEYSCKVSLIGWSLSGICARAIARQAPECIRMIITLAAPFNEFGEIPNHTKMMSEFMLGEKMGRIDMSLWKKLEIPPPVPSTAIFTRTDGMVPWKTCRERNDYLDEMSENIEVEGSHFGLINNPSVVWAIADRLSQPEDQWQPFNRSGSCCFLYRDPDRQNYFSI